MRGMTAGVHRCCFHQVSLHQTGCPAPDRSGPPRFYGTYFNESRLPKCGMVKRPFAWVCRDGRPFVEDRCLRIMILEGSVPKGPTNRVLTMAQVFPMLSTNHQADKTNHFAGPWIASPDFWVRARVGQPCQGGFCQVPRASCRWTSGALCRSPSSSCPPTEEPGAGAVEGGGWDVGLAVSVRIRRQACGRRKTREFNTHVACMSDNVQVFRFLLHAWYHFMVSRLGQRSGSTVTSFIFKRAATAVRTLWPQSREETQSPLRRPHFRQTPSVIATARPHLMVLGRWWIPRFTNHPFQSPATKPRWVPSLLGPYYGLRSQSACSRPVLRSNMFSRCPIGRCESRSRIAFM